MHIGKRIRMNRILNQKTGRCVIVPMDHGVTNGPIDGLVDAALAVSEMALGGADAVLMHKGLAPCACGHAGPDVGLVVHLSAGTSLSPYPNAKVLVTTVEEALCLGADGVSVHVNLGDPAEGAMLADLGATARESHKWGIPLLAMIYARGPGIADPLAPRLIAHCARVAAELGADLVKVPYTGDPDSFSRVVEGCSVPVLIAGGQRMNDASAFLSMTIDSLAAGAVGISAGRNVFQHPHPRLLVKALSGIVHRGWGLEQALAVTVEKH